MATRFTLIIVISFAWSSGCTQKTNSTENSIHVGGNCEGCEAIYESPVPFDKLKSIDTLPDFNEPGPRVEISGIVYQRDGRTPAKNVVIYVYHTDQTGHYTPSPKAKGWEKRNGRIRGWMKTDKNGFYSFYTLKPAPYPNTNIPAHIHIIVKEPDKNEYYLDEYLFAGDPNLRGNESGDSPRGGNGILKMVQDKDGKMHGTRHIFLGLNIPDYPWTGLPKLNSGLDIGQTCPDFLPLHISGADSGRVVSPMSDKIDRGIMIWFNHANVEQLENFAKNFETKMIQEGDKKLKVFLVYMNPFYNQNSAQGQQILERKLKKWCNDNGLRHIGLLWIPSPVDEKSCGIYKINPEAKNTIFLFEKRRVVDKWVNIEYDDATLKTILKRLDGI